MEEKVNAVILAGGQVYGFQDPVPKAALYVNGKSVVAKMIDTLKKSSRVAEITLVSEDYLSRNDIFWAPAGSTMMESMIFGLKCVGSKPTLVIFADVLFAHVAAIDSFIEACLAKPDTDIWCAYISYELFKSKYSDVPKTCAYVREGRRVNKYCMAGIGMIRPAKAETVAAQVDRLTILRKNVLKLAWTIGPANAFWYCLGRMTIARIEREMERILGVRICAIESNYPELGFDIDNDKDLELAKAYANKFEGAL